MIVSPYHNTPHADVQKTTAYIDREDVRFLKGIYPVHGGWQNIIGFFVKSVVEECKKQGITYYSSENVDRFEEIVRRCAAPQSTGSTNPPNVRARKKSTARTNKAKQKVVRNAKDPGS